MARLLLTMTEWSTATPETHPVLQNPVLPPNPKLWRALENLKAQRKLIVDDLRQGLRIQTTSWIGRVTIGDLQVVIEPKLTDLPRSSLCNLLRYAFELRQLQQLPESESDSSAFSFQDLLISQLAGEVEELLSRGLSRQYQRVGESLASPRGRIDLQRLALQGPLCRASLPCSHFPRVADWLPNQLLASGLKLAAGLANDGPLAMRVRRLASVIEPDVTQIRITRAVFDAWQRTRNRLVEPYAAAIRLIEALFEGAGLSFDHSDELRLPSFLFDMNRFFQKLLSRFLHDNLPESGIQDESKLGGLFIYTSDPKPKRSPDPILKPDFAIFRGSRVVALLDAKYRDLWEHTLPSGMLYQLAIYALSQPGQPEARTATILYPTTNDAAEETRLEIRDPQLRHQIGSVFQRPVNLQRLADLLNPSTDSGTAAARAAYCQRLVFGKSGATREAIGTAVIVDSATRTVARMSRP